MPLTRDSYRARLELTVTNNIYYDNYALDDSIQDGYDEIAAVSGLYVRATAIKFVANKTYYDLLSIIPDYLGVIAIFNRTMNRWMYPSSVRKFDIDRIDWETCGGTPYYFSPVSHRFVAIYKKPLVADYGQMYVFYHASAPTLGSSNTLAIPDQFITVLEDFNVTDLWEQNQEWSKASDRFKAYASNLEKLRVWVKTNRMPDRLPTLKG